MSGYQHSCDVTKTDIPKLVVVTDLKGYFGGVN